MSDARTSGADILNVLFDAFDAAPITPQARTFCARALLSNVADMLVESALPGQDPVMPLVQSYSVLADGRTFRFHLAENRKFHNGEDITAADVLHAIQIHVTERAPHGTLAQVLDPARVNREGQHEDMRRISRFKFEIVAVAHPNLDLLSILAAERIPVFSAAEHKRGRYVFGGLYAPVRHAAGAIDLALFDAHPGVYRRQFPRISVRPFAPDETARADEALRAPHTIVVCENVHGAARLAASGAARFAFQAPVGHVYLLGVSKRHERDAMAIRHAVVDALSKHASSELLGASEPVQSVYPKGHPLWVPV